MKQVIRIILVAIFVLPVSIDSSYAQSCNSAAQVVSDIWNKTRNLAIQQGCQFANVQTAGLIDYSACFNTAAFLQNLNFNLVQYWNSKVNNTWATIGPRRLDYNVEHTGTIVGTTGRVFVSLPTFSNSVTVVIDETGGKGKTSVMVCKVNTNNQHTEVATRWFNDTNKRKDKTNEHREITVNGAKNHIIIVHFDGKSVGNTFKYKLRATSN